MAGKYLSYSNSILSGANVSRMRASVAFSGFRKSGILTPGWLDLLTNRIGYVLGSSLTLCLGGLSAGGFTAHPDTTPALRGTVTLPTLLPTVESLIHPIQPAPTIDGGLTNSSPVRVERGPAAPTSFLLVKSFRQSERANLDFRVGGIPASTLRAPRFRETYNSNANDFSRAGRFFVGPALTNNVSFGSASLNLISHIRGKISKLGRRGGVLKRFGSCGKVHRYVARIATRFVSWRRLSTNRKGRLNSKGDSFYGYILRYRLVGYARRYFFKAKKLPKPSYGVRKKWLRRSLRYNRTRLTTRGMTRR